MAAQESPQFAPFQGSQLTVLRNNMAINRVNKLNPQWGQALQSAAQQYQVEPYQIADTINRESGWNANAHSSSSSASGLGQFIHSTAQELGVNPNDPLSSINGVAKYLSYLRGTGVPNNEPELTKAYILGPGGYKQMAAGGSPVGIEQIPGALKQLSQMNAEVGMPQIAVNSPVHPSQDINNPSPINPTMPNNSQTGYPLPSQMEMAENSAQLPEFLNETLAHKIAMQWRNGSNI